MTGRMVVGYDGSDDSRVALSWAVAMARKWTVDLVAVSCWVPPMAPGLPQLPPDYLAAMEEHTTAALSNALHECGAYAEGLDVDVRVIQSPAADALLEEAKDADMLVVGSHGGGGRGRMRLGGVARECVLYATCPVVIVRPDATWTAPGGAQGPGG
jgi:nucleotide-binding universal stress UspA family protein